MVVHSDSRGSADGPSVLVLKKVFIFANNYFLEAGAKQER